MGGGEKARLFLPLGFETEVGGGGEEGGTHLYLGMPGIEHNRARADSDEWPGGGGGGGGRGGGGSECRLISTCGFH